MSMVLNVIYLELILVLRWPTIQPRICQSGKRSPSSYCHRNWNHQRPVELQFNRKDPYAPLTPPDSAKIIVGLNGSGKSTLLKTINHFFSLIGGFKHPTDIQIEDFKTKCIERGVGTFQVEIQFDIHRVEPMGGREQDPYVLKFPRSY